MHTKYFFGSLTRVAGLRDREFTVKPVSRSRWATGDFVVCEVIDAMTPLARVELDSGRMIEVVAGDRMVGAFGVRRATLETVGDWREIRDDHRMHALTAAGLLGRATSRAAMMPALLGLHYEGHVLLDGEKAVMSDFVPDVPSRALETAIALIVGTSMSAGKTTAAKIIVRLLKGLGLKVIGAKLTGAGRYRDILTMKDAGADAIFDFVDVGLPSTVCPAEEYRSALRRLLSLISGVGADLVVAEAGASPLEPYNGAVAIEEIEDRVAAVVLCASDPYAAVGVIDSFGIRPDLIAGPATSTEASVELVERLTGVEGVNILLKESRAALKSMLRERLEV